jgi:NAD(P)-dependent dehydrogenase (short-subunit alcohol dehydrogenase family)
MAVNIIVKEGIEDKLMSIRYDSKVAIITGAGRGLGRSHAIELAKRGAKVLVNDFGGGKDGSVGSSDSALAVVAEIEALGGEAIANGANVANYKEVAAMVKQAADTWGRVDILINNAGILRDKSFANGSLDEFKLVVDVHLMGSVNCTKACWDIMRKQVYGRIVVTTSSSGLYGNFGQANYGSAKMAVIGMMNTLAQEGAKYNIKVNALAPTAGTRMTEGLIPEKAFDLLTPETVTPAVLYLVSEEAPTRIIMAAGAGAYPIAKIVETDGVWLAPENQTPEGIADNWEAITSPDGEAVPQAGSEQTLKFLQKAAANLGIDLSSRNGV